MEQKEAEIFDGNKIAGEIRSEIQSKIQEWMKKENHRTPSLITIQAGDDSASCTYVKVATKAANDIGIKISSIHLPSSVSEADLMKTIDDANKDDSIDGILLLLPLPEHINERNVCNSLSPTKDVDGLDVINAGRLSLDMKEALIPCTALAVQEIIKRSKIETFGKNAVVIGRAKHLGMPIMMLLHADGRNGTEAMDATVTLCHNLTPHDDLTKFCKMADIIVSAIGEPKFIKADMIKPGAAVIDIGLSQVIDEKTGKQKLVGDVDFEEVKKIAGFITPVPGGIGPMIVAMLMRNTFKAAEKLAETRKNN